MILEAVQASPSPVCGVVGFLNPVAGGVCTAAKSAVSTAVASVSHDFFQQTAKWFAGEIADVLKLLATAWVAIPSPFTSNGGGAQDGTAAWLGQELHWLVMACLVLGTIVGCILAMWNAGQGRRIGDDVERLGLAVVRVVVVAFTGAVFIGLLMAMGTGFSTWILAQAGTTWSGANAGSFTTLAVADPPLVTVLGLLVALAGLVQIVVVAGIAVLLPILVGLWPCSAALSSTEGGSAVWKKHTGWIAAAVLFKPTAAVIYAASFKMMSGTVACQAGVKCDAQSTTELSLIFGLLLLMFAVLAMPALMRLVVPAVAAVGGVAGGEVIGAAVSLATGAMLLAGGAGAGALGTGAIDTSSYPAGGPGGGPGAAGSEGGTGASGSSGGTGSSGPGGGGGAPPSGGPVPAGPSAPPSGGPADSAAARSPGGRSARAGAGLSAAGRGVSGAMDVASRLVPAGDEGGE